MSADPGWARDLDDVDEETVQLILNLHLQDAEALASTATATEKAAVDLYASEIKRYRGARAFEREETALAEASARAASNAEPTRPATNEWASESHHHVPTFQCVICEDRFDSMHCYPVPCGHHYCNEDLEALFRTSLTDVTLYPPRCCRQIVQFEDVRIFLSDALAQDFQAKREELDDTKPTYCHVPTCSTYIGDSGKNADIATCPECGEETCIPCKQAHHSGDCAKDAAVETTLQLAEREGWRKCPGCERLVELSLGCYHMTCLCRAEFCYLCGVRWKNCGCEQFAEQHLLHRGQEIANRERRGDLANVMANLRANHDCVVHEWIHVRGPNRCDNCGDNLPTFIFRCRACRTQSCRRCRFNRD